ncbi:DUF3558 domain-containing protein [Amycolatopsis suaedae]|uniref:DUF3558 domain-containing protein n=1 Tax=Amycolatopsis suaedae TaxID=2510978 RepID=A0A4Q7JEE1_9PSEU|nr:DUF3558 domain-containing protein [Amycolatopsis suaedae]
MAGCGSDPAPQQQPQTPASPPAPSPAAQRPRDLPIAGVDPCSLFTQQQLDELKVTRKPKQLEADDQRDGPTCSLGVSVGQPHYTYYVELIADADLQDWVSGRHAENSMTSEPADVAGYPALTRFARGESPSDCETMVGVAQGQTLRSQMYPVTQGVFDQKQLCDMAKQAATAAVRTLEAKG